MLTARPCFLYHECKARDPVTSFIPAFLLYRHKDIFPLVGPLVWDHGTLGRAYASLDADQPFIQYHFVEHTKDFLWKSSSSLM